MAAVDETAALHCHHSFPGPPAQAGGPAFC